MTCEGLSYIHLIHVICTIQSTFIQTMFIKNANSHFNFVADDRRFMSPVNVELPASSYPLRVTRFSSYPPSGNSVAGNSSQSSTLNHIELPASGKLDGKNQA